MKWSNAGEVTQISSGVEVHLFSTSQNHRALSMTLNRAVNYLKKRNLIIIKYLHISK